MQKGLQNKECFCHRITRQSACLSPRVSHDALFRRLCFWRVGQRTKDKKLTFLLTRSQNNLPFCCYLMVAVLEESVSDWFSWICRILCQKLFILLTLDFDDFKEILHFMVILGPSWTSVLDLSIFFFQTKCTSQGKEILLFKVKWFGEEVFISF